MATSVCGCSDPKTADECVELAIERFNNEDYSAAMRLCDRAIELEPENCGGHSMRAIVNQGLGNLEEAIADYTRAIELAPDDGTKSAMYTMRNSVYHAMGDQLNRAKDLVEAKRLESRLDESR